MADETDDQDGLDAILPVWHDPATRAYSMGSLSRPISEYCDGLPMDMYAIHLRNCPSPLTTQTTLGQKSNCLRLERLPEFVSANLTCAYLMFDQARPAGTETARVGTEMA